MPTRKRRLYITMQPSFDSAIAELARLTGKPEATVVSDLLAEAAPALVGMVDALRVAQKAPQEAAARMARVVGDSVAEVVQVSLDLRRKPGRPRKRG